MAEPPDPSAGGQGAERIIFPLVLGYPHSGAACGPRPPGGSRELSRTGASGQKELVPAELRTNLLTLASCRLLCDWVCNGEEATRSLRTHGPASCPACNRKPPAWLPRTQVSEVIDGPGHAPGLGWQPLGVGWGWGWWASHALHCAILKEALEPWPSGCCRSCGPRPPTRGPAGRTGLGPLPLDSGPRRSWGEAGPSSPWDQTPAPLIGCGVWGAYSSGPHLG